MFRSIEETRAWLTISPSSAMVVAEKAMTAASEHASATLVINNALPFIAKHQEKDPVA